MPYTDPERNKESIRKWRLNNKAKINLYARRNNFKRRYGITLEQRAALLRKQRYRCAGCRTKTPGKRGWQIDHCHDKKHVRGILCIHCNLALGYVRDNVRTLRKLITYLQSNK